MITNQTNVTHGMYAGAVASIAWWIIGELYGVVAPAEIVAASVVLLTALVQAVTPYRAPKNDNLL